MLIYEGLTINKKHYRGLPESEFNTFVDSIFEYYRRTGFPYIKLTDTERQAAFVKLMSYTPDLIEDDVVIQRMAGLALAWHYFPHAWSIPIVGMKRTPLDVFADDDLLRKAIIKRLKFGDNISDNGLRKALMVFGTQRVSNFRPTAAKAIYRHFLPKGGRVWDMSAGFGGRLLGALASNVPIWYTGCDPSAKTFEGLEAIKSEFGGDNVMLYQVGSENYVPDAESLDLCFTSPPYFDTEQYSDEPTQSYKRFPTHEQWTDGYLRRTMNNCLFGLKRGGHMVINIANVKTFQTLEDVTVKTAEGLGFTLVKTMWLQLSKVPSVHGTEKITHKYEPIFIFGKL